MKPLIFFAFLLIVTGFNSGAQVSPTTDQALSTELDKIMNDRFKSDGVGAAILVARQGHVIFKKGYGMADLESNTPVTPLTVFRIASLTNRQRQKGRWFCNFGR